MHVVAYRNFFGGVHGTTSSRFSLFSSLLFVLSSSIERSRFRLPALSLPMEFVQFPSDTHPHESPQENAFLRQPHLPIRQPVLQPQPFLRDLERFGGTGFDVRSTVVSLSAEFCELERCKMPIMSVKPI